MLTTCPETFPVVQGHEPAVANAIATTCDWIKLTNAQGCLITVMFTYVDDNDFTLTVHEGLTDAGGTTEIAVEFPIWVNTDTSTSDAMVRQTDAVTYVINTGTAATDHIVQFYIDASILTATYDWIQLDTAVAGGTSNIASVLYQLVGSRYKQETPPTAIA